MSKLKNYTLLIIDMQPYFDAAYDNKPLFQKIKREIKKAINLNNHIMFVRMTYCGGITRTLRRAVKGYPNVSVIHKDDSDGSNEVLSKLNKTHLRVCGVNTDQCVEETICSIAKAYPKRFKIEIIAKGCASDGRHTLALKRMARKRNIKIDRAV